MLLIMIYVLLQSVRSAILKRCLYILLAILVDESKKNGDIIQSFTYSPGFSLLPNKLQPGKATFLAV
jgi:hypothetical protein